MGALIAFTAEYLPWVTGAGILLFLIFGSYKKREFWMIVQAFAGAIIARFVFTEIIRYFYDRQRPFEIVDGMKQLIQHSPGGSFPSGHAAFFFALATGVFFYRKRWGILFYALAFSIGFGRVAAGLHWTSDIFGGAVVGILSALLMRVLMKKLRYL